MKHELFSIGITIYKLFFNSFPFCTKKDFIIYKKYVLESIPLDIIDIDPSEYPSLISLYHKKNENIWFDKKERRKEAILLDISERRNEWIKNMTRDNIIKKNDFYNDKMLYDLLYRLIKQNTVESITNYKDFYNHPFFSQYQY